jgi:IS5 family transposase
VARIGPILRRKCAQGLGLAVLCSLSRAEQLQQPIDPFYPKVVGAGRPPIGLAQHAAHVCLQQCFGLSDEGIEDAVYDSQAIRGFVGIDLNRKFPTPS